MPQCIATVFKAALKLLQALLCPPKGRHSRRTRPHRRRRRSSRVRRYAPMTPASPTPLPSHPAAQKTQVKTQVSTSVRARAKAQPEPRVSEAEPHRKLRPPSTEFDADDIALVRPYYTAHEAEADRAQSRAALRLRAWGADLDLGFGPKADGTPVYTLDDYAGTEPDERPAPAEPSDRTGQTSEAEQEPAPRAPDDTFHVPAPRIPSPRLPSRMDRLPHLSRIRDRQQQRRAGNLTGAGV